MIAVLTDCEETGCWPVEHSGIDCRGKACPKAVVVGMEKRGKIQEVLRW